MRGRTPSTRWSAVLDSADAGALADFYLNLLGWKIRSQEPDWVTIEPGDGSGYLAFQTNDTYVPPVWPAGPGDQQMQFHLDIGVDDLDAGLAHAEACGATRAAFQPQADGPGERVIVLLDPAGHPFCLFPDAEPQPSEDGSAGTSTA